jgi:phosphoribosylformylglycinamidine synthase
VLFLLGTTKNELGGSHHHIACGIAGGSVPKVDMQLAPQLFQKLHTAMVQGLVRSCHDLSEGGLAAALAEMAFAGGVGAEVSELPSIAAEPDEVLLFAESPSRFLVEVKPEHVPALQQCLAGVPHFRIGQTTGTPQLRIAGTDGKWVIDLPLAELKEAWQKPLRW